MKKKTLDLDGLDGQTVPKSAWPIEEEREMKTRRIVAIVLIFALAFAAFANGTSEKAQPEAAAEAKG